MSIANVESELNSEMNIVLLSNEEIEEAWKIFNATRSTDLRNKLTNHYFPTVERTAKAVGKHLPEGVRLEDLISAGLKGLTSAIENYQFPSKATFETYSHKRIWGAMIDDLRRNDWPKRRIREMQKRVFSVRRKLMGILCRTPSDEEMAIEMKMDFTEYFALKKLVSVPTMYHLGQGKGFSIDRRIVGELGQIPYRKVSHPSGRMEEHERMKELFQGLTQRERTFMIMYYFDDHTFSELGEFFRLSQSAIVAMHKKIKDLVKLQFEGVHIRQGKKSEMLTEPSGLEEKPTPTASAQSPSVPPCTASEPLES